MRISKKRMNERELLEYEKDLKKLRVLPMEYWEDSLKTRLKFWNTMPKKAYKEQRKQIDQMLKLKDLEETVIGEKDLVSIKKDLEEVLNDTEISPIFKESDFSHYTEENQQKTENIFNSIVDDFYEFEEEIKEVLKVTFINSDLKKFELGVDREEPRKTYLIDFKFCKEQFFTNLKMVGIPLVLRMEME